MKRICLFILFLFLGGCSVNILTEFSDPTANDALLFDAQELLDKGDYAGALAVFETMSADFLAQRNVRVLRASAYLGLCSGIDFLDLVTALDDLGSTRVMPWLMDTFQGGSALRQAACISAEDQLKAVSPFGAGRTSDENLLMAFVGFAKMGIIISRLGDSGTPDGVVDAGFDPCDPGDLPQDEAREIATGFNIAMDSLENIGSSTIGSGALGSVTTVCAGLPVGYLPLCDDPPQVDTDDIDANEELGIRTIINESQDVGLGTCSGDAMTCACL